MEECIYLWVRPDGHLVMTTLNQLGSTSPLSSNVSGISWGCTGCGTLWGAGGGGTPAGTGTITRPTPGNWAMTLNYISILVFGLVDNTTTG